MRSVKVRGTTQCTDIAAEFVPDAPAPISTTSEIPKFLQLLAGAVPLALSG